MNDENEELNTKPRKKPGPKPRIERGRSGIDLPPAMQSTEQGLVSSSREEAAHSAGRPERISMANMKKLEVPESLLDRENYYYRWFQDRDGRVNQAQAAYYTFVTNEQGENYTRNSGPYKMHLMKLPIEYRKQDEALKRERVRATLDQEAQIGHNEYAPDVNGRAEGGTSAISHHTSESHQS